MVLDLYCFKYKCHRDHCELEVRHRFREGLISDTEQAALLDIVACEADRLGETFRRHFILLLSRRPVDVVMDASDLVYRLGAFETCFLSMVWQFQITVFLLFAKPIPIFIGFSPTPSLYYYDNPIRAQVSSLDMHTNQVVRAANGTFPS